MCACVRVLNTDSEKEQIISLLKMIDPCTLNTKYHTEKNQKSQIESLHLMQVVHYFQLEIIICTE